jgi:predicted kinase
MISKFKSFYAEEVAPMSKQQLSSLEVVLDKAFAKLGIDVEFTKHFLDRVNDARNKTQITAKELALLYKKEYIKYGKPLAKLPDGEQGVMKDLESDINIPFVINVNRSTKEVELVAKTIMRKKNFTTPNRQYPVESTQLEEGINDPAIFKAVFLAGGPGSGKSFIVGQTALTALGFKLINSDDAFEAALAKVGLKPTPEDIYSELGQSTRVKAKILTSKKMELAANGRLGLVIDGTGKDFGNIKKQADALRKLGYDIAMIFVNTDLDTALQRNRKRVRTLPDDQVTTMWKEVQKNLGKFQSLFRQKMYIVDNSEGSNYQGAVLSVYKKMAAWAKAKPDSKGATAWIKAQKAARNIKEENHDMKCNECAEYGSAFCKDCLQEAKKPKINNALAMAKVFDKINKAIPPVKEDAPGNSVAAGGVDMAPTMGPRKKVGVELINMTDRRRSPKKLPVLLKRFRKYMDDKRVDK